MTRTPRPALSAHAWRWLPGCLAALATACGGGGSGDPIPPSSRFQGRLLAGSGAADADWDATSCSASRHRTWVRSYLNEDYLFYTQAPLLEIAPAPFTGSPQQLFDTYTALPDDPFSFVTTHAEADAAFVTGTATSTGIRFVRDPVRLSIRVAFVEPNSPAASLGVARGMQLESVNGTPLAADAATGQPVLSALQFAALTGTPEGGSVGLGLSTPPAATVAPFDVPVKRFTETPVLDARVLPAEGSRPVTAYLAYTSFGTPVGESQLSDAIRTFAEAGASDLVVDLRYNGGGFIFIASQLAHMVAGPGRTAGQAFQKLAHNDKRSSRDSVTPFTAQITSLLRNPRAGEALPTLSLSRVFVLTSAETCSASEGFISGLRGVGIEAVLIGSPTCGKPYGSVRRNNCALSYFPLSFEARNALDQVVPLSGLAPSCPAADDLDHALGNPAERLLSQALTYAATGACPTPATGAAFKAKVQALAPGIPRAPLHSTQLHLPD